MNKKEKLRVINVKTKDVLKVAIKFLFYYGGCFHFIKLLNNILGRRLTIVTYHRLTGKKISEINKSLPYLFVRTETFEKQLKFLERNYKIITFNELLKFVKSNNLPWDSLIITFDDGYEDFYYYVYPILKKINSKATMFMTVDMVGNKSHKLFWWDRAYYYFHELEKKMFKKNDLDKEIMSLAKEFHKNPSQFFSTLNKRKTSDVNNLLTNIKNKYKISDELIFKANRILDWQQISEMRGYLEIGSHTCSHLNLITLAKERRNHEIYESKKIIEQKTGKTVAAFSYPHGNKNKELENMVKDAGYKFAVTTYRGINKLKNMYSLKRINIWESTSQVNARFSKGYFAFKLLGF